MLPLPLAGIRVLDLTMVWAGPYATRILADLGAEVIKVEGVRNWDLLRDLHLLGPGVERAYDKSAYFNHLARNKYGCTIDLVQPAGRELCLRLAALSDVVIENYRPDVMKNLDLEYEAFTAVRPDIIMVSMPGHGKDGPEAMRIAYGTNVEQLGGLVSIQGYPDRGPHKSGISYGDPMSGIAAAGAVIAALFHRRATGEGQYVELAQREALTNLIGEHLVGYSMSLGSQDGGRVPGPIGNRHVSMAPHGCYPAAGEDEWVTIAARDDADFAALCEVMGQPALGRDARFADVVSRHRNQDELDAILSEWTRQRGAKETAALLTGSGVPAAPVLGAAGLYEDEQMRARGLFEVVAHAVAGVWEMDGVPWHFSRTPAHVRLPPPAFAEHNDYVLSTLLGLDAAEVEALRASGVIGDAPERG
jgi:crotonobetainyl-CoA:carnitine CoA-transferase CaiB-like acyl-CoA transferase